MSEVPSNQKNQKPQKGNFEKVVNFQADVGRTATHINKIITCVFGGILIVIGLVFIGDGLYLMHKKSKQSPKPSNPPNIANKSIDDDTNKDQGNFHVIGGAIAVVFGLVIILISCLVHSMAKKSKGFAAVYGTGVELQALGNIGNALFR